MDPQPAGLFSNPVDPLELMNRLISSVWSNVTTSTQHDNSFKNPEVQSCGFHVSSFQVKLITYSRRHNIYRTDFVFCKQRSETSPSPGSRKIGLRAGPPGHSTNQTTPGQLFLRMCPTKVKTWQDSGGQAALRRTGGRNRSWYVCL